MKLYALIVAFLWMRAGVSEAVCLPESFSFYMKRELFLLVFDSRVEGIASTDAYNAESL